MVDASIVVVGAGGHARELVGIARQAGVPVAGLISSLAPDSLVLERLRLDWLGDFEVLTGLGLPCVIGSGYPDERARVDRELSRRGVGVKTLVHPASVIGHDVLFGDGVVIGAGAIITTSVELGRQTHIGAGAVVSYECTLGDFVTLGPRVALSGEVALRDRVFVGAGAVVVPGCTVGAGSVIAAGAVVTGNVPDGVTAKGIPARW